MKQQRCSFSIIIPTRNEAADIMATLEHAVGQTLPAEEIIVVDDSDDGTPSIVTAAARQFPNIRLLHGTRSGRSGARNLGILNSRSDVVVILNADVHLPSDFLERLQVHYRAGASYVLVGWEVTNAESPRARFVLAQSLAEFQSDTSIEWTEGFSCRRDLALKVGLFPITPVPLVAGEDGPFGAALGKQGKKVVDRALRVSFLVPVSPAAFWRTYKERAYPHAHYYLYHRTIRHIVLRTMAKQLVRALRFLLVFPTFLYCWQLCRFSVLGWRDMLHFVAADAFQKLAYTAGEWEGLVKLRMGYVA